MSANEHPISVYIDNNVWDFLFLHQIDLSAALPRPDFCICITREAEFEIPPIRENKPWLEEFIRASISKCLVEVDSYFGFYDERFPSEQQRVSGFNSGRFADIEELEFMQQQRTPLKERHSRMRPKTGLFQDEADISLAARAKHSVVLSLDQKKGPINDAYLQGGNVVFLAEFDPARASLAEYIRAALDRRAG